MRYHALFVVHYLVENIFACVSIKCDIFMNILFIIFYNDRGFRKGKGAEHAQNVSQMKNLSTFKFTYIHMYVHTYM